VVVRSGTKGGDFDADELKKLVIREFANQFFTLEQVFVADVAGNTLKFQVIDLSVVDLKYITGETNKKEGSALSFLSSAALLSLTYPLPLSHQLNPFLLRFAGCCCCCWSARIDWKASGSGYSPEGHRRYVRKGTQFQHSSGGCLWTGRVHAL
jgi:hypothetical protein